MSPIIRRPRFTSPDRALVALISSLVPRDRWASHLTPARPVPAPFYPVEVRVHRGVVVGCINAHAADHVSTNRRLSELRIMSKSFAHDVRQVEVPTTVPSVRHAANFGELNRANA